MNIEVAWTYAFYLGNGDRQKLVVNPIFDLRVLNWCLQKVSSSVFGSLDLFVTNLKRTEYRNWMMSRSSFRHAINMI